MLKAHYANAIGDNLVKAGIRVNKNLEPNILPFLIQSMREISTRLQTIERKAEVKENKEEEKAEG